MVDLVFVDWHDRTDAELQFLGALLAAPRDGLRRAAYADWLEGRGRAGEAWAHRHGWASVGHSGDGRVEGALAGRPALAVVPAGVPAYPMSALVFGLYLSNPGVGRGLSPPAGWVLPAAWLGTRPLLVGPGWEVAVCALREALAVVARTGSYGRRQDGATGRREAPPLPAPDPTHDASRLQYKVECPVIELH